MVDIMNREEHVFSGPAADIETPTPVAELCIQLVPGDPGNSPPVGYMQRPRKDHGGGSSVHDRIRAAIEAETAAVPEAAAEVIDRELSQIMSSRPAIDHPGTRLPHTVPRRSPLTEAFRGSLEALWAGYAASTPWRTGSGSDDPEPTAAAELRIMVLHS
jgi:hypothetical protein